MLGMHGTYEANMAMHDCDVMICIGARFDDRITGRLDAFSPGSKKIHIDIDPSSINKNVHVDIADHRRCRPRSGGHGAVWAGFEEDRSQAALKTGGPRSTKWRARNSLAYPSNKDVIMPQYAIQRLYELTKDRDTYITTEVGQHQMWAAQFYGFEEPNRWMTSGGWAPWAMACPAAIGVQVAHRDAW
jgi:acetolactate synthase-1/2/3 large subunit